MSSETGFSDLTAPAFRRIILALGAFFLVIEAFCILRTPVVMDEFVDAEIVHELASKLPYRDLPLGKTVLGYYVQLPVLMAFAADSWRALLAVKFEMALLAAAGIIFAAIVLGRSYSRIAVVAGFALLVTMSTWYERAADFRSDMLTGAAGLIALLFLVTRKPGWAGLWCAVSLMMSQKGAYYVLASEAALAVAAVSVRRRENLRDLFVFNLVSAVSFGAYLGFWILVSSPRAVLYNTFIAQQTNAFATHFTDIRWTFWSQTLRRNPVFYAISAAAIAFLVRRAAARRDERDVLLATYGVILAALFIWHKQPWPYFFVMLAPLLFVLQVPLLDSLFRSGSERRQRQMAAAVIAASVVVLIFRIPAFVERDSRFQQATFRLGNAILRQGGTYFAGAPVFYTVKQGGGPEINSVDTVQREYLESLRPEQLLGLVRRLDTQPVRFIVFSYRIDALPLLMRQYLVSTFEPYWGAIFIYAPKIGTTAFTLHFDGHYVIESRSPVTIDGAQHSPGARIHLSRGTHSASASAPFRLRLDPDGVASYLDERYREVQDFFPAVYTF